jgi:hypothetical protein
MFANVSTEWRCWRSRLSLSFCGAVAVTLAAAVLFPMASTALGGVLDPFAFAPLPSLTSQDNFLDIDTSAVTINGRQGVLHLQSDSSQIAVFTFDDVSIVSGTAVTIRGPRPFAILSRGDMFIGNVTFNADGRSGTDGGAGVAGGGRAGSSPSAMPFSGSKARF